MTTLEILMTARATIKDGEWNYGNWNECTCGHIYTAIVGRSISEDEVLGNMDHPILMEVAVALGFMPSLINRGTTAGDYISQMTSVEFSDPERADGLRVVDEAIARLEAQHEAARLDVLAQVKEVVDNTVVKEVVTV